MYRSYYKYCKHYVSLVGADYKAIAEAIRSLQLRQIISFFIIRLRGARINDI